MVKQRVAAYLEEANLRRGAVIYVSMLASKATIEGASLDNPFVATVP